MTQPAPVADSEATIRNRIDALSRKGRKREALAEANRYMAQHTASAALRAQRGYLRRGLQDIAGAVVDFRAALAGEGLTAKQRRNVTAALAEAQRAGRRPTGRFARRNVRIDPNSDAAIRGRIDALIRAGRQSEAQAEIDTLVSRGHAPASAYVQRGYARRDAEDFKRSAGFRCGASSRRSRCSQRAECALCARGSRSDAGQT